MKRVLLAGCLLNPAMAVDEPSNSLAERPNFVVIMADDLGYGDISPYGGWIETPNLQRMADEGLRLTDFHSNGPVCSPTRAALMTGRYQQRAGIAGVVVAALDGATHHHGLQKRERTLAEALKGVGYATAICGKWHLGYDEPFKPTHHGFDLFRGFVSGNVDYFSKVDQAGVYDWWDGLKSIEEPGYLTTLLTKHGLEFIDRHREQPFFLYLPHAAPHYPYQGPGDEGFRKPGVAKPSRDRDPERIRQAYREMVVELDRSVGAVLDRLEQTGLAANTMVIFCSDNGACKWGDNGALRGSKGTLWEGGHRVPAIVWWPGRIKAGRVNDSLCASMDIMPTLLGLAGVKREGPALDGKDLRRLLLGGESRSKRRIFWEYRGSTAMRDGPWKLVIAGGKESLHHLGDDPGEATNLAGQEAKRLAVMKTALREWRRIVERDASPQPPKRGIRLVPHQ